MSYRELWRSANVPVREDVTGFSSLPLQTLNAIAGCDSVVAAKVVCVCLENVEFAEQTGAALLAGWTHESIDVVRKRDELSVTLECLNTNMTAVTLQSELQKAQG